MNSVILSGNLTKDVVTNKANNGTLIATASIAINKGEKANYFDLVAYKEKAELLSKYCHKGSKILIRGELTQDLWQDKEGRNKSALRIIVNEIEFLSKKETGEATEAQEEPVEDTSVQEGDLPF